MPEKLDLRQLIEQIAEAFRTRDRAVFDEEYPHERGNPASAQQIAALERHIGKPVPPSYRAFLELHNGWDKFQGGAKLLSVEDQNSKWVKDKMAFWSNLWEPDDDGEDPFEAGMIPILFGEDTNSFLVLDPRKARKNGEMDFVMYDYTEEEERFKTFTDFLKHKLEILQQEVETEREGTREDDEDEE